MNQLFSTSPLMRIGPPPEPGRHYTPRPGAYAIAMRAGRVLLTYQHSSREYQLPGGGIDPGEGQISALTREAREETGWRMTPLRRIGGYRRFCFMPVYDLWAEKICHIWLAHPVLRQGQPEEAGHDAVWLSPDQAIARIRDPGAVLFLKRVF